MSEIDREVDVSERLNIIRNLPIRLDDKIFMSLVCLDLIPAWEVDFCEKEMGVEEFEAKLIDAGFQTRTMEKDGNYEDQPQKLWEICYSNSVELVEKLFKLNGKSFNTGGGQKPHVEAEYGKLYGFPPTAVEAYVKDKQSVFSRRNLPVDVENEDYVFLAQFALSKDNWRQELETPKKWAAALAQYVPDLWQEFVAKWRAAKAVNYGDWPMSN